MKFTLGNVIGKTVKYTIIGTSKLSYIIGKTTSKAVTNEVIKEKILKATEKVSSKIKTCSEPIAELCEKGVDSTILVSGKITGKMSKTIATMCNASEQNIMKAEEIGNKVGKVVVGGGIGLASSALLITTASAVGTAGAATTTSGLATLGGGSIAAGGTGMVGGLAVTSSITTATAFAAHNTEEEKDTKKLNQNKK